MGIDIGQTGTARPRETPGWSDPAEVLNRFLDNHTATNQLTTTGSTP